ncbi:hypothetical protein [Brevundimonas sp.]|uniref:hypothetical protein n=1 Tax=Brevundimonas sp. TaxID=1871086 RepID=UPI003D0F9A4F
MLTQPAPVNEPPTAKTAGVVQSQAVKKGGVSRPPAVPPSMVSERIPWLNDMIDKQYRLYAWNDARVQVLATINGLLITALTFLFKDGPRTTFSLACLVTALIALCAGLLICLWFLRDFPNSRRSQAPGSPNVRSLNGITAYADWEAYETALLTMSAERYFKDSARQIYGMAINNVRCHATMRQGSILTMLGAIILVIGAALQMAPTPPATAIAPSAPSIAVSLAKGGPHAQTPVAAPPASPAREVTETEP